jgi:hypothetical protein
LLLAETLLSPRGCRGVTGCDSFSIPRRQPLECDAARILFAASLRFAPLHSSRFASFVPALIVAGINRA